MIDIFTNEYALNCSSKNGNNMKRMMSRFLMLGLITMILFGCKKEEGIKFSLTYDTTFTIPNGTGVSTPVSIVMPNTVSNSEAEFASNNTSNEKIDNIGLTSLSMEIISPSGDEFDFLEDIELFISADGVDEMLLAYVYNMENIVGTTISLTCSQGDFKELLKKDNFTLRARTVSDELISSDVEIKITSAFVVDATLND